MEKDPFKEYMKESEPDKAGKSYVWSTAIGLQAVDGLKTSEYLLHTLFQDYGKSIFLERETQELQRSFLSNI